MEEDLLKTKPYISDFLNLREQKATLVSVRERELEDHMELIEGTAKYIELRLSELLPNGYQAIDAIRKHPQFNDYKDVILSPHQFIQKAKTGELTSDRICTTGTIMCSLLDRVLINDWKKDLFKNYHEQKVTLCYLLKERYSNVGFGAHNEEEQ